MRMSRADPLLIHTFKVIWDKKAYYAESLYPPDAPFYTTGWFKLHIRYVNRTTFAPFPYNFPSENVTRTKEVPERYCRYFLAGTRRLKGEIKHWLRSTDCNSDCNTIQHLICYMSFIMSGEISRAFMRKIMSTFVLNFVRNMITNIF